MLAHQRHCRYAKPPVAEVICQFRFPRIAAIDQADPTAFREAIREDFPHFLRRQEQILPQAAPGQTVSGPQKLQIVTNYQFTSADGFWRVNLTSGFLSLTCTRYTTWAAFAAHLDKPLASFLQLFRPAHFERVGLRYLNFISRSGLELEGVPFAQLLAPCYLGPLGEPDVTEDTVNRCSVDCELRLRGGCRARVHAGPGKVKRGGKEDPEVKFIFDQDLFMAGPLPLNLAVPAMNTLHDQAFQLFRNAVTDRLHRAMEPVE